MKKFTKTLVIGCLLVFLIGYIIYKVNFKKENFQTVRSANSNVDGVCVYTSTDAYSNTTQLPQCSPGPISMYDTSWSFPTNILPTMQPEWTHYIKCERAGMDIVSTFQQNFLGNVYTQIVKNLGMTLSSYDTGTNPPWDQELNGYEKADVCWGNVNIEASESIFAKAFLAQQAANAAYLPKEDDENGLPNSVLAIPQSAWTIQQQQQFQNYNSTQSSSKQFATQCGAALYDTAISMAAPIAIGAATSLIKKGIMKNGYLKNLITSSEEYSQKRISSIGDILSRKTNIGRHVSKRILEKMGPGAAKDAAQKVLGKGASKAASKTLSKVGARFAESIAVGATVIGPSCPWGFAVYSIAQCVGMVAAALIGNAYMEKKCGNQGCCKNGENAWSDMVPQGMATNLVDTVGSLIPGLGFILTVFGIVQPFGCTAYGWDFYGGMLGSIVTTCVIGQYLPTPEPFSAAVKVAAQISCYSLQAAFVATCIAPGGAFSLKQTPTFPNFMHIPHTTLCFRDWYQGFKDGTGNYDCQAGIVPPWPIYDKGSQSANFGAHGFAASSILKYAYVNGKNPRFLDMAAQYYYEQSFANQKATPVDGLYIYEYIEQFVAIVASSAYSFDCLVNIREITFQPDTGAICCSRLKYNRDRRFYISYASYAQLNPANQTTSGRPAVNWGGDYDWDFTVTGCTYVDGTAPELFNYSDTTQYQWDVIGFGESYKGIAQSLKDTAVAVATAGAGTQGAAAATNMAASLITRANILLGRGLAAARTASATNSATLCYDKVAAGTYNNDVYAEISGNTYIELNLLDDMGNSTPITLNVVSLDFSYSVYPGSPFVPWINGVPQPYTCSNIIFCRTAMPTYEKCSSFNTLSKFIDDYQATYPNRHIKEIRNMEPQIKVTSLMNQAGGMDVPAGDVCEYDLAYVSYDSNINSEGATQTVHCNVYYKFDLNLDPSSPTSNYLTCTFTQSSNLSKRLYGDMQATVSNYYGSVNEYSNGYLTVSHGPMDMLTGKHTPLRGYPFIDSNTKIDNGKKCGPLGFVPPRSLPAETVLGDGQCASNDSNICKNPLILSAFMNDYNGGGITAYTTSNSKCYIDSNGTWFRDSNDTKILNIGKVVTPAVPNSKGTSPLYNRCDVEFDLLSNNGPNSTILRTTTHFFVSNVGAAADCSFAYQTGSYGPVGSGNFIQYNTPNLTDQVQFMDENGVSTNYNSVNYVGGFLQSLVEKYNKFILFVTGNGGVAKIGGNMLSNDPLAILLSNTEDLLGRSDQMLSNMYSNMTFNHCPTPSEGGLGCQDPHLLSEMQKAYNIQNYPKQQFNVTAKFMDQIFRVAVSGTGNTGPASCDAVFSSWAVKYYDLFGLPVGNPVRQLEGARFFFTPTNPGNPTCSYNVMMENCNSFISLQDSNGSIALRVAGSNLAIPFPALTTPICSVICSDPKTMDYVATFANKYGSLYAQKFYASFQASPMKCQYLVSDIPNSSNFNRAFQVAFEFDNSTTKCSPVLNYTLADQITGKIVDAVSYIFSGGGIFSKAGANKARHTNYQEFTMNDIVYNPNLSNGIYTKKSDSNFIYDFPGIFMYGSNNMPTKSGIFSNLNYVPTLAK